MSADKDLMQLVNDQVSFVHTGRDKVYDRAMVASSFDMRASSACCCRPSR